MISAGTYEVNIEVRGVGQAISGLNIFCGGWEREARQDVDQFNDWEGAGM